MKLNEQGKTHNEKSSHKENTKENKSSETKVNNDIKETNPNNKKENNESNIIQTKKDKEENDTKPPEKDEGKKIDTKENKEKSMKKHELSPGTVARLSTTNESLTKDIIRVIPLFGRLPLLFMNI